MNIIGLTGGIGSGKSYIAQALRDKGYIVYDCDAEAKRIINNDSMVKEAITLAFGTNAYTPNYNTRYIADICFRDTTKLTQLNNIVHPAVLNDILAKSEEIAQNNEYFFIESAILFESKLDEICQATVTITAPLEVRIKRAMKRDNATKEQIEQRIANQMSDSERNARASFVIINDGNTSINEIMNTILRNIQ